MVALDERHHTFLQALMRRGPLSEKETRSMFRQLFSCDDDKFFDFVTTVNKELDCLQMEVRGSTNQYNGKLYYGIVNKLANEEAKNGTRLTHAQLTFFKAILESVISDSSASGSISGMQALNLRLDTQIDIQTQEEASTSQAASARLTLAAKEETLATLVSDNWLSRTHDGRVRLGTKSFLELRSLFKNFDVPFCDVCNEAAIKAEPCQNEDCKLRMHSYCVPRKFQRRQTPRVCPGCSTAWRMPPENGNAADNSDDENNTRNDCTPHEVDDEDEDAEVQVVASRRRTRRAMPSQPRGKVKLQSSDDDDSDDAPPAPSQSEGRRVIQGRPKMKARR